MCLMRTKNKKEKFEWCRKDDLPFIALESAIYIDKL